MATTKHAAPTSDTSKNVPYYIHDADLPELPLPVQKLFEEYGKIPAAQVQPHVLEMRERAWQIFPFPCIGRMRFLDFSLSSMPSYPEILSSLSRTEDPSTLLDVGCCFGQDLRRLVVDGAPGSQVVGVELKADFIDLGYDLFKDRETFERRFIAGNVFDDTVGSAMNALNGTIDIIHAASFLHLFGWDEQLKAAVRLVRFLKDIPGTILLGRQIGSSKPGEYPHSASEGGATYSHNEETFRMFWAEVEKQTTTKWQLETSMKTVGVNGPTVELLYFEATRIV